MVIQNLRIKVLKIILKNYETLPYIADKDKDELYHKYRRILEVIIRVLHYLGKQNIAFKCHREEINSDINSINLGNFIALKKLQAVNDPMNTFMNTFLPR